MMTKLGRIGVSVFMLAGLLAGGCASNKDHASGKSESPARNAAVVSSHGNFSISLTVKDIAASRAFYEALGFTVVGGDQKQNWLVMQNGTTNIGLFQGMFPKNMLTFNPGWTSAATPLEKFEDIRELQARLKAKGIAFALEADANSTGPASFVINDPDGNPILFDQHVPKPGTGGK